MMNKKTSEENHKPAYLVPYGQYEEDELRLVDLWAILAQRKWWMIATFITTLVITITIVISLKSVYSSTSIVQIGKVAGEPLESVDNVVSSLRGQFLAGYSQGNYPSLVSVETEARLKSDLVTLISHGSDPKEARDFLQSVTLKIIERYKNYYDEGLNVQENRIEYLTRTLENMKMQIDLLGAQKNDLDTIDKSQAILIEIERSRLFEQVANLESELTSLEMDLTAIGTRPPEVLKKPEVNHNPIKPRRKLLVMMSVIGSFLSGIFVAFFVDFLIRSRAEIMSA